MSLSKLLSKIPKPDKRKDLFSSPPAIALLQGKRPKYDPSELIKFECRQQVEDVDEGTTSATGAKYTVTIAKFGGGSPEELLDFLKNLYEVFEGQEVYHARGRHNMMQQVLSGDALACFNNKSEELSVMSSSNFNKCVQALKEHIFPYQSLPYQKRFMRNAFKKPSNWTIRQFVSRLQEVNNYLPAFPPFKGDQKLAEEEIIEILKYGSPAKWTHELTRQGDGGKEKTLSEIVQFFERQALAEGRRVTYDSECLRKVDERIPRKRDSSDYTGYPSELYCDFCNKKGHSLMECRKYKKAKQEYSSMSNYKTPPFKQSSYFKKPTYKKEFSGKTYHKARHPGERKYNREEVKFMMDRREQKVHEQYKARANGRAKKSESYHIDLSESESESGVKRKIDFSSSDESKSIAAKPNKGSDSSSQDSDEESRLSHYGFEDRDDIVFGNKKGKGNYHK